MNKAKAQVFEGVLSVAVNALLFAVKFWAGIVTGSIAVIADAWHTLSDSLTSIFVAFSVKLSLKKPDKEHPFGHGRWEQISSVFVAIVLGIIGYEFIGKSIQRFNGKAPVEYGMLAVVVTVVSIIVKEVLAQFAFFIGRKTDNAVVIADGWHHRSDSLSSIVVLAGIITARFVPQFWWIDSALGVIVALMLFYAAFRILKDSIDKLLGEEPGQELTFKIKNEIKEIFKDDLSIHHIHIHNYSLQKELTMHIRLNKDTTIENGHITATIIEKMILEKFGMAATIHVEPLLDLFNNSVSY